MALTISQGLLFIILSCATGLCIGVILVYMAVLMVHRRRMGDLEPEDAAREAHPHAWRTKV
jgi:predicted ABC-type sugar transport system permease subunit